MIADKHPSAVVSCSLNGLLGSLNGSLGFLNGIAVLEFDSENSPLEDHEYPEEDEGGFDDYSDDEADDETEVVACPNCGTDVYEDAVRCPVCETYLTLRSHVWGGKSWWWVALGLVGIVATLWALSIG